MFMWTEAHVLSPCFYVFSADEMCVAHILVFPTPNLHLCSSGFADDAVSEWLNEAYDAGYWNINTSNGESVADLIAGGSIESAGDLHPVLWSYVGGKWDSKKEGANAMFDKLLNDEAYSGRISLCGESADSFTETESTFQDTFGDFKEYCTDSCGCDADTTKHDVNSAAGILVILAVSAGAAVIIAIVLAVLCRYRIRCSRIPTKCTGFLSIRTQAIFRRFFQWLGIRIHSKPMWFIAFGGALVALCSASGFVYYRLFCGDGACTESRGYSLWIPQQNTLWSQYTEVIDTFGVYPSSLYLLLTVVDDDESILSPSNMDIAFEIANSINNITLYDHNDRDFEYSDLCTRSSRTQSDCDSSNETFFAVLFQNNESLWSEINSTLSIINPPDYTSLEFAYYIDRMNGSWDEIKTLIQILNIPDYPTALYLGGLEYAEDDTARIIGAQYLRIAYSLEGSTNSTV